MPSNDLLVSTLQKWVEIFMRRSMQDFIAYAREMGLSMSQIGTLFHVYHGKSSVSEISDFLGVSNAASSQLLERLVQGGLVLRTEDPNDRRCKQIVLTDRGAEIIRESIAVRFEWLDGMAQGLSDSERDQVLQGVKLLVEKSSQLEQPTGAV
jgi:DNA-binding MarR family transcriptional regulator